MVGIRRLDIRQVFNAMSPHHKPQLHCTFRKLLTGSDLSRRRLPEMRLDSGLPGPVVWLTACAHGDEVGGMVVIQEVFRRLRRGLLRCGCIRAFPLLNPLGFEVGSRKVTLSGEDLNRSFPGSATGSLGERIAHLVFSTIEESAPAVVLDLHNDWLHSIPYVLLDVQPHGATSKLMQSTQRLARRMRLPLVQEVAPLASTLSATLLSRGIPALTVELSESRVVNEQLVVVGVHAVERVLAQFEMMEEHPAETAATAVPDIPGYESGSVLRYSEAIRASTSGIIRFKVTAGQSIRSGQEMATVHNAFGRLLERVRATDDGLVLGLTDSSVAYPGVPVAALGLFNESHSSKPTR